MIVRKVRNALSIRNLFRLKKKNEQDNIELHTLQNNGSSINIKIRPDLSLRIPTFHRSSRSLSLSPSERRSPGVLSFNSDVIRRSSRNKDSIGASSSTSAIGSDRESRSTNILSYIAADDMDEFEDLQKEFQSAVDDKGFTWLPQLEVLKSKKLDEEQIPEQDNEYPTPSRNESTSPNVSLGRRYSIISETGPADKENVKTKIENMESFQTFTEDINIDDSNIHLSSYEVDLPNFDEIFERGFSKNLNLYGYSLGFISPINSVRVKLAYMHVNRNYNLLYYACLVIFTILLSYRTYNPVNYVFLFSFTSAVNIINFILGVLFTIRDITKIIAFGFWDDSQMYRAFSKEYITIVAWLDLDKYFNNMRNRYGPIIDSFVPLRLLSHISKLEHRWMTRNYVTKEGYTNKKDQEFDCPRVFARSSWNRNDLLSSCCFWIAFFISFNNYDVKQGIIIFKALSVIRILRLLDTDTGISSILRGIKHGLPQLVSVGSMLLYFWVFFGILGVQIFKGSLKRQCVWKNPDDASDTYQYNLQFCGGFLEPQTKKRRIYLY